MLAHTNATLLFIPMPTPSHSIVIIRYNCAHWELYVRHKTHTSANGVACRSRARSTIMNLTNTSASSIKATDMNSAGCCSKYKNKTTRNYGTWCCTEPWKPMETPQRRPVSTYVRLLRIALTNRRTTAWRRGSNT